MESYTMGTYWTAIRFSCCPADDLDVFSKTGETPVKELSKSSRSTGDAKRPLSVLFNSFLSSLLGLDPNAAS